MNTHMWDHPLTERHLANLRALRVGIIPPIVKRLACGDFGAGGLAEVDTVVQAVRDALARTAAADVDGEGGGGATVTVSNDSPVPPAVNS